MLAESGIPGTDDWWIARLGEKLGDGLPRLGKLRQYRDAEALLPDNAWDKGTRESYKRFVRRSRLHVVETIRDARTDRQKVVGFRTGADDDEDGDQMAWSHWTANRMGVQSRPFFNDIADYGEAFLLTLPESERARPVITRWNGWRAAVETDPMRPWRTQAGITYGHDPILGVEVVTLYRPGYYRMAYRPTSTPSLPDDGSPWHPGTGWQWAERRETPWTSEALLTRASTYDGFGVYEKHLDTVDRINEITLNALTLIVMQSFRQRGVKGNLPEHYPEGHPKAGQEVDYDEIFEAGPAALWMLPVGADIWESQTADVRPIYEARKSEIQTLSSLTRTPQDIFNGDSQNQSAMGAQISREPLKYATENMNENAAVAFAQSLSHSFEITGDSARSDVTQIEVMFAKVNPATMAEKADAASKFKNGGMTQRFIDTEVAEMTPRQRRQAETDRTAEGFQMALADAIGGGVSNAGSSTGASAR